MSEKRRNRENSSETVSLGLSASTNKQIIIGETIKSNDSNQSNKSGRIAYLKSHFWIVGLIALLTLGAFGAGLKYLEDAAKVERATKGSNNSEQSLFSKLNPFTANPLPTATPQLSKEYIYSGGNGRLLAVGDAGANAAPPADLAIWRPSSGEWWVMSGSGSQQITQAWGSSGDKTVPGDYDGDSKTDFAVFRPSNSTWYIIYSAGGGNQLTFGTTYDMEVQADYDGDGRTDAAIFRPSTGTWYVSRSSDSSWMVQAFGLASDTPVPADYDGDGKADFAYWRNSDATFYILRSSNNQLQTIAFGQSGDKPVPGDYDGDGKADAAVWRGGVYQWHILYSSTGTTEGFTFGDPNSDVYVQNDYDGDGKVDRAFWRPSTGIWYIVQSSKRGQADEVRTVQWGIAGDIPVPAFYKR